METLGKLYLWLRVQKLNPPVPVSLVDELGVEIVGVVEGEKVLRSVRR